MKTAIQNDLMTADEFFEWANLQENQGKSYELEDGKVVEVSRPGHLHGVICSWIATLLWDYARQIGQGHVASNDTGLLVRKRPDTLRGPDIMFFRDSMSIDAAPRTYVKTVPALVVEVMSPNDRHGKTMKRVGQYLKRGIPLVWVVDPDDRIVSVHRPKELVKILDETDTVSGNGVLPGFKHTVADFFNLPGSTPLRKQS